MSVTVNGSNGITFNDGSSQTAAASPLGLKNRIINGDMRIDQRNAGAAVSISNTNKFIVDRFKVDNATDGVVSVQQSTVAPNNFINSMGVTVTTADASIGASQYSFIRQSIEGLNVADLGWGTANAQTVTVSFWVRSSVTGTFGGSIQNSAENRAYAFTYAISSANTWEQKSVTITGDTTGTWLTTNGVGLLLNFSLGTGTTYSSTANTWAAQTSFNATGSVALLNTLNATFYITGVQLEVGSTATPFERRLYNQELANCQRYCYVAGGGSLYERIATGGWWNSTTLAFPIVSLPVTMRSASGMAVSYSSLTHFNIAAGHTGLNPTSIALDSASNGNLICLSVNVASGGTTGAVANLYAFNSLSARLYVTCEL